MIIQVRKRWFINSVAGRTEVTTGAASFVVAAPPGPQYDNGLGVLVPYASAMHFPLTYSATEGWYADYEMPDSLLGIKFQIRAEHSLRPGRALSEEHLITAADDDPEEQPADIASGGTFPPQS